MLTPLTMWCSMSTRLKYHGSYFFLNLWNFSLSMETTHYFPPSHLKCSILGPHSPQHSRTLTIELPFLFRVHFLAHFFKTTTLTKLGVSPDVQCWILLNYYCGMFCTWVFYYDGPWPTTCWFRWLDCSVGHGWHSVHTANWRWHP